MVRCDSTIAVTKATKEKLHQFKLIEDETYDNMINRLIDEIDNLKKQITKKYRSKNKKLEI